MGPPLVVDNRLSRAMVPGILGPCSVGNPRRKFLFPLRRDEPMWNLPPADSVLQVLSLVALAAQAMTAALAAGRRSMDWMGVAMLGCVTALGGGTIRDLLLQHYPLVWVQNPSFLGLTAIAALLTIPIARLVHRLIMAFLALNAIGLVVFTMAGCDVAWQKQASLTIVIVAGMMTGCA